MYLSDRSFIRAILCNGISSYKIVNRHFSFYQFSACPTKSQQKATRKRTRNALVRFVISIEKTPRPGGDGFGSRGGEIDAILEKVVKRPAGETGWKTAVTRTFETNLPARQSGHR